MRLRRKTPRELQIERTLRDWGAATATPQEGDGLWVALATAEIRPQDTARDIVRPTYQGYADERISFDAAQGFGLVRNSEAVTFAECTAGSSTVSHFAVYEGETGRILAAATVSPPVTISTTNTPATFGAGALVVGIDDLLVTP